MEGVNSTVPERAESNCRTSVDSVVWAFYSPARH